MFLQECVKAANEHKGASPAVVVIGGRGPVTSKSRRPLSTMMRVGRHQGAPFKCPLIRESLWTFYLRTFVAEAGTHEGPLPSR